ncbi:MAG TPA: hypothetical protein VK578_16825 [Edaphobacter sp.]|nr:hypothetical protein [Edaphobacter sp.]
MKKIRNSLLLSPLLFAIILPAGAQRHNDDFNRGVRKGGHGGQYYDNRNYDHHDDHHSGGIGPGKGALIGGAGGAAIGAIFGGGLKGTIVGGAAGAGIGAIAGQVNQNNRDDHYQHHR